MGCDGNSVTYCDFKHFLHTLAVTFSCMYQNDVKGSARSLEYSDNNQWVENAGKHRVIRGHYILNCNIITATVESVFRLIKFP